MKYTAQSSKYVAKNFPYLFPFAILPAIFLAISTDKAAIEKVLTAILQKNVHAWSFGEIFRAISVLNFVGWESIVFGIVGILAIIPCVALLMALLEKHMRIGKRTFNGLWGKLNDNFISTAGYALLLLGIYEFWALLAAAFLFLVSRITIFWLAMVFVVLVFILFHILLIVAISTIYLWLPCMQITGFRAYEALVYSYQLMGQIKNLIIAAQLCVLILTEGLICVCAYFIRNFLLFNVIVAVLYACLIMIFCVRMQIAYFDLDHIERADISKYYQR